MTTASELIDVTLRMLRAGTREQLNVLAADVDAAATTFVVESELGGIQEGASVELGDELGYVRSVTPSTKSFTGIRGYEASTPAAHVAGTVVRVNPKFTRISVFDSMNHVLSDLSGRGLCRRLTKALTYNANTVGYDLDASSVIDVLEVTRETTGPELDWPLIPRSRWRFRANADTTDFPSGSALLVESGAADPGRGLRVVYTAPFVALTATSDVVETVTGLSATALDLLTYGAAMRMVFWRETMRNVFEAQGDSKRAQEVPAGAQIGAARAWQAIFEDRIKSELRRQKRRDVRAVYG